MKVVRVLHIVAVMNRGGLETLIMNIYRKIDKNKVQFDFLVTREEKGIFDNEIKALGGKVYNIPSMEKVGYKKYKKNIEQFLQQNPQYKIIHCHRNKLSGVYLDVAKKMNVPIRICHSHSTKSIEESSIKGVLKYLYKFYISKYILSSATHFFACGYEAGKWLYGQEIANKKLEIIKNGIDLEKFKFNESLRNEERKKLGIDENTIILGHVGRFNIPKNHDYLIDIFYEINKLNSFVKLCLVGNGTLKKQIEEKVKRLGIEKNVIFLGEREDINKLMMAFDICVFPSIYEGLPVTLIEAQATGLKCRISSNITKEVDMEVGLVKYISIKDINEWIKVLLYDIDDLKNNKDRTSELSSITLKGYNIIDTAKRLQRKYLYLERGVENG